MNYYLQCCFKFKDLKKKIFLDDYEEIVEKEIDEINEELNKNLVEKIWKC
jgi:hypothetical protein